MFYGWSRVACAIANWRCPDTGQRIARIIHVICKRCYIFESTVFIDSCWIVCRFIRTRARIHTRYGAKSYVSFWKHIGYDIVWSQSGNKPLPKPTITKCPDISMPCSASIIWNGFAKFCWAFNTLKLRYLCNRIYKANGDKESPGYQCSDIIET